MPIGKRVQTAIVSFRTKNGQPPTPEEFKATFGVPDHGFSENFGFIAHKDAAGGKAFYALVTFWAASDLRKKTPPDLIAVYYNNNHESARIKAFHHFGKVKLREFAPTYGEMREMFNAHSKKYAAEMDAIFTAHPEIHGEGINMDLDTRKMYIELSLPKSSKGKTKDIPRQVGDFEIRLRFCGMARAC